jgi:transcriptional regulator with XRE-family HTH domain
MDGRALLAWNLRRLRAEKQIAQERLAADARVDRAYLSKAERGEANPTVDVLDRLAATLGVDIGCLFSPKSPGDPTPSPLKRGRRPRR